VRDGDARASGETSRATDGSRILTGEWRAAAADEELRRRYPDPHFDDAAWEPISVPGHWRSSPAFAGADGPILYRTRVRAPEPFGPGAAERDGDRRTFVVFDGVFYTSDVWFDGTYLGDTEGYFFPHAFEVTDALAGGDDHVLAVEVACTPQLDRRRKRNLTGVFQHWDLIDQDANPGGIWRAVRLEQSGPVRILHRRLLCRDADERSATLFCRVVLDSSTTRPVELRTLVVDPAGREVVELVRDQPLARGENRIEWTVTVPEPRLWWPHTLGDQPRYEVTVEVLVDGVVSDRVSRLTGLRRIRLRDWICSVNGERLFLKGTNLGPTRLALGEATAEEVTGDVALAREAGLDLIRVHAHVGRPELYEAADTLGMLVWQDLPLQWGYARSVRAEARRQAREAVDLLAHHPSVAVWCAHNEPFALDIEPDALADPRRRRRLALQGLAAQMLPTWNKTVLDRSISSVLERTDGSRPVVPHSGVLPHPPQLDGTDSHLYLGWYGGDERDLPRLLRLWPRLARFVTEFGAQAVPEDAAFLDPARWPDLDWERAARHHALQKACFDRTVPPADHDDLASWRAATQRHQAELIRLYVETLRRLKYRPCGGFAQFCLADAQPAVTWSVLDHERRPKEGYRALLAACRPVIIVADRLPRRLVAGARTSLEVHAVSDLRVTLPDLVATARLSWTEQGRPRSLEWSWEGDLPADACTRIGAMTFAVPDADGSLAVDLVLRHAATRDGVDDTVATNHYTAAGPGTTTPG